jgi:RHS repeat-associated protein
LILFGFRERKIVTRIRFHQQIVYLQSLGDQLIYFKNLRTHGGTTETETKYYSGPTGRFAEALLCNAFAEFELRSNSMRAAAILEFSLCENSPLTGVSRSFDHLGSSSVILEEDGDVISRTTYTAFGEERDNWGVSSPTDYTYTGQRSYTDDFGLMFYNARWYDPVTAHFAQADTIIPQPGNSGDWNRYAYVLYNPMRYIDPTGHFPLIGLVIVGIFILTSVTSSVHKETAPSQGLFQMLFNQEYKIHI